MKKEIADRWVEALRSGEYPQTEAVLYRLTPYEDKPVGFCCLGVLSDLAVKDGVISAEPDEDSGVMVYDGCSSYPPGRVKEWAGMYAVDPNVTYDGTEYTISVLNDDFGLTFDQIADVIERNYEDM